MQILSLLTKPVAIMPNDASDALLLTDRTDVTTYIGVCTTHRLG